MLTTLIATAVTAGAFKCAPTRDPQVATSADQRVKVIVLAEGKVMVYHKGSDKPKHTGRWSGFGHHQRVVTNRDGSAFAVYDQYGGMEVFDGTARKVAFLEPRKVLHADELEKIPGKWTCHMEGTWLEKPVFDFQKDRLEFTIYNGRKVRVLY